MNLKRKHKIGALDRRIMLRIYTVKADDYGQEVKTWEDFVEVWANVRNTTGLEKEASSKKTSFENTIFMVRYSDHTKTLSEPDRILYNSNTYEIKAVFEEAETRHRYLKIIAQLIT